VARCEEEGPALAAPRVADETERGAALLERDDAAGPADA
jgi:hypothetical protein